MNSIQQYIKDKLRLIKQYEALLDSGILPVGEITYDAVMERKTSLDNEKFSLAVCGQIKSGKSTLINALIFRNSILPFDDTPLTAKITFINHGEKTAARILFYSVSEWQTIKKDYSKHASLQEDFNKNIENSIRLGVYKEEYIKEPALELSVPLDALTDYVAAPSPNRSQGRFTPFVKSISITANLPWLNEVTIVDTPGINDPCKLNSNVTEKWINQADAVIYVAYAGRALDRADIDFINTMLAGVSASHRIVAINKCDIFENLDEQDLKNWAASLSNSNNSCIKNIFAHHNQFHYVSSLGALISNIEDQGNPLDESFEYYKKNLSEKGYLSPEKHGFIDLMSAVETKLMKNKGQAILESNRAFLEGVFNRAKRLIEFDIGLVKEDLAALVLNKDQLEEKIIKVKKNRIEVEKWRKEIQTNWEAKLCVLRNDLHSKMVTEIKSSIEEDARREFKKKSEIHKIKALSLELAWIVKSTIEKNYPSFRNTADQLSSKLQQHYEDLHQAITNYLLKECDVSLSLANTIIVFPVSDLVMEVYKIAEHSLGEEILKSVIADRKTFWEKVSRKIKSDGELFSALDSSLRKCISDVCNKFFEMLFNENLVPTSGALFSNLESELKTILQKRQETYETLVTEDRDLEKVKSKLKLQLVTEEEKLKQLKQSRDKVMT